MIPQKLTLILLLLPTMALAAEPEVLLRETFDGRQPGPLAKAVLAKDQARLAPGAGPDGSDCLRVNYEGYARGSRRVVAVVPLARPVSRATLSFSVKFARDFQWTRGGKLHGLAPLRPVTGGGPRQPDRWSARIVFRPQGHCQTYLYDQDPDQQYGVGQRSAEPVFQAGQWHRVSLAVRLNDPGQTNGVARVLVDGELVAESKGVTFRGQGGEATLIQQFLFSTFHGGHDPSWSPVDEAGKPTTVVAWFDNFEVTAE